MGIDFFQCMDLIHKISNCRNMGLRTMVLQIFYDSIRLQIQNYPAVCHISCFRIRGQIIEILGLLIMQANKTFITTKSIDQLTSKARLLIRAFQMPYCFEFIWETDCLTVPCCSCGWKRDVMDTLSMLVHVTFLAIGATTFWTNKGLLVGMVTTNMLDYRCFTIRSAIVTGSSIGVCTGAIVEMTFFFATAIVEGRLENGHSDF